MDEKELQALFDSVSQKFNVGDFNSFRQKMLTPDQRKSFYDVVSKKGISLGDYQTYENRIGGVKKKEETISPVYSPISQDIQSPSQSQVGTSDDPVKDAIAPLRDKYQNLSGRFNILNQNEASHSDNITQKPMMTREGKPIPTIGSEYSNIKNDFHKSADDYITAKTAVENSLFKNGLEAKDALTKLPNNPDNETRQLAQAKSDEYDNVAGEVLGSQSIEAAALNDKLKNDPLFSEQYNKLKSEGLPLPDAKVGSITADYMYKNGNNIEALASQHPDEVKDDYEDLKNNLLLKHPDFGVGVVANQISREREKLGYNSSVANFHTKTFDKHNDEIASTLSQQAQQLWKDHKDDITKMIDTGGIVNRFEEGIESGFGNTKGLFKRVTGQSSKGERLSDELNNEATTVSNGEKGWKKSLGTIGNFAGTIAYMAAGNNVLGGLGANPVVADKAMTGLTFGEQMMRDGEKKYPDNEAKALTSGIANTLAFMALSPFKAGKVGDALSKVQPELEAAISKLPEDASTQTMRDALTGAFQKSVMQYGEGVAGMGGLTLFNQGLDKALGLNKKAYEQYHPENELPSTLKTMALGLLVPSGVIGIGEYGKRNVAKNTLYDIATHPEDYKTATDDSKNGESVRDKIDFLAKTKDQLDQHNIPVKSQKDYILHAINEQNLSERLTDDTESSIKKNIQDKIKRSQDIKNGILNNIHEEKTIENQSKKVVKEFYDNNLLPKQDEKLVEKESTTEGGEPKFDEKKVKDYLETIVQKDDKAKAKYPTTLVEAAEQMFPDYQKETSEPEVSEKPTVTKSNQSVPDEKPKLNTSLNNVTSTTNALEGIFGTQEYNKIIKSLPDDAPLLGGGKSTSRWISEHYHESKKNGTNNDLVKSVEYALKPEEIKQSKTYENIVPLKTETSQSSETEPIEVSKEPAEGTGITHAATEETRKKFGLGNYERNNATDAELEEQANEAISKGYNPETLIRQMEGGTPPTGVENFILRKYKATLEAKFEKNPTAENLEPIERLVKATDKIGSLQSEAFRTRKGLEPVDDTRSGFFINEKAANNDAPLTENQKETANTEYDKLNEAKEKFAADQAKFEDEVKQFRAEQESAKTKKSTPRNPRKTHEDFVNERKDILEHAREKLRKARGETQASIIPYAKELIAIAPDVAKMVRSLAEEGIYKLEDVIKSVHAQFKDDIPDLKEKDVRDIIAGEYNDKKVTKKDAAIKAENLRIEAQLLSKLDKLMSGEKPKNEKATVKRNQEIEDLRKRIEQVTKEDLEQNKFHGEQMDEGFKKLQSLIKNNEKETASIKEKIKQGDFAHPEKKPSALEDKELQNKFPEVFKAAQKSRDALIKVKHDITIRRLKQMYENKSDQAKMLEIFSKSLNVPRTLMASFDFSAPLRQGIVASTAHPILASDALKFMFKAAADEKVYNRWLDDVHNSPRWDDASKSGLSITDPESLHVKEREEAFQGAPYAEKIPLIGRGVAASERAYVGYLNHLRWNLFNMFADRFEEQGKTFGNNPDLYKGLSSFINSSTGRGNMKGLEAAAPILNWVLFASRLISSRLNMLGLSDVPNLAVRGLTLGKRGIDYGFYSKLPKELRVEAAKDMLKFIATGASILALAHYGLGLQTDTDPRSSDFGKIRDGNTRWDIWGGFQPYARVLTQMIAGQRKLTTTGEIKELDGKGIFGENRFSPLVTFGREKLAPVPSTAWNLATGKNAIGQPVTVGGELEQDLVPLIANDVYTAMQDQGIKALFTVGIPSAFGVGVQTYQPKPPKNDFKGGGAHSSYKPHKSLKTHEKTH